MSHTIIDAVMIHYAARFDDRCYHLYHAVDDAWQATQELVNSMRWYGWDGPPAVVLSDVVIVGNKRMVAAMLAGIEPEVHEISVYNPDGSEEIDDLAWALAQACDTDEMLQYALALQQHGAIDDYSVSLLEQEVAKESRAR